MKRLAKPSSSKPLETLPPQQPKIPANLHIVDYNEKSCAVIGDTIKYSNDLSKLGGLFNERLRVGPGWIFSKQRQESVEYYLATGEIKIINTKPPVQTFTIEQVDEVFMQLRDAFESDAEYDGSSVIDLVGQVEKIFLTTVEKNTTWSNNNKKVVVDTVDDTVDAVDDNVESSDADEEYESSESDSD